MTVGVLWTSVVGAVVSWRWLSVSVLVFVLVWVVLLAILPNSPIYLLSKQQFEAARIALQKVIRLYYLFLGNRSSDVLESLSFEENIGVILRL